VSIGKGHCCCKTSSAPATLSTDAEPEKQILKGKKELGSHGNKVTGTNPRCSTGLSQQTADGSVEQKVPTLLSSKPH